MKDLQQHYQYLGIRGIIIPHSSLPKYPGVRYFAIGSETNGLGLARCCSRGGFAVARAHRLPSSTSGSARSNSPRALHRRRRIAGKEHHVHSAPRAENTSASPRGQAPSALRRRREGPAHAPPPSPDHAAQHGRGGQTARRVASSLASRTSGTRGQGTAGAWPGFWPALQRIGSQAGSAATTPHEVHPVHAARLAPAARTDYGRRAAKRRAGESPGALAVEDQHHRPDSRSRPAVQHLPAPRAPAGGTVRHPPAARRSAAGRSRPPVGGNRGMGRVKGDHRHSVHYCAHQGVRTSSASNQGWRFTMPYSARTDAARGRPAVKRRAPAATCSDTPLLQMPAQRGPATPAPAAAGARACITLPAMPAQSGGGGRSDPLASSPGSRRPSAPRPRAKDRRTRPPSARSSRAAGRPRGR